MVPGWFAEFSTTVGVFFGDYKIFKISAMENGAAEIFHCAMA